MAMWFKFPEGVDQISINQQNFHPEFEKDGEKFFRAPDHFAGQLLDLPGFTAPGQPEGAPDDIPSVPSTESVALEMVSANVENLRTQVADLRALLAETGAQRDEALLKIINLEAENANLKAELAGELEAEIPGSKSSKK